MTTYSKNKAVRKRVTLQTFIAIFILLLLLTIYISTLAQFPVFGDPTEYTFVANMLGIAHPPGYAFITLLGKLFQTLVPVGTVAWRMHLLSAVVGTVACLFVFGSVYTAGKNLRGLESRKGLSIASGLFAALSVGTAVNHWQHAIHANPHIITGTFLVANLFFLTKWWASQKEKWLLIFSFSAGLGITHHPLTVFGFVGYGLFVLAVRPSLWREWKTLLKMTVMALLGLTVWLYFPLRSPMDPGFGPTTMNTLNGFLDHILARGLTESLPFFGLADQPHRQLIFWTLLRLQYTLPTILLSLFGFGWLIYQCIRNRQKDASSPCPLLLLYTIPLLGTYLFVISLRQQDIMAYLIGPLAVIGLWAGIGLFGLLQAIFNAKEQRGKGAKIVGYSLLIVFFLAGPIFQFSQNAPLISLQNYREGLDYVDAVFNWFNGQNEGAVLLNDWEHMTPLWYTQFVEERWPDEADVRPEFISTGGANPWQEGIFKFLPGGPVYFSNFRPTAVAGTEFRLRPAGPFYQVVEPGDETLPPGVTAVSALGDDIEIVGFELPQTEVTAGDFVPLTLAMSTPNGTDDYYVPVLTVGTGENALRYEFTTDSHLITPNWWPNEVIAERFDFALPHNLPGGNYPLSVDLKNLSQDELIPVNLNIGTLHVTAPQNPPDTSDLLANFRQRVGLTNATASVNGRRAQAPWDKSGPLTANPGDTITLILEWESLASAEESYTIFVHLIDGNNFPHVALDYTPLGGATPTHLWIPKWLPGQQMLDPYRLQIPETLPPGTYFVEVGLYEMINGRRLHIADQQGSLNGDRYILGTVQIEPEAD